MDTKNPCQPDRQLVPGFDTYVANPVPGCQFGISDFQRRDLTLQRIRGCYELDQGVIVVKQSNWYD